MGKVKIAIGIVDNHPSLFKGFAFSLLGVVRHFDTWRMEKKQKDGMDYILDIMVVENGRVDDMRNTVADQAIKGGYDYIFWMDSDQTFPENCLPRLLSYCERDGREAASGLYTFKYPPYLPHVYPKLHEESGKFHVSTEFPIEAPMIIEGAGFGCLLMKTSVFKRLNKPYFTMTFTDGIMTEGEDLPFCKRAKMNMILDPEISCGHLKTTSFGIIDFLRYNEIEIKDGWAKPTAEQTKKVIDKHLKL